MNSRSLAMLVAVLITMVAFQEACWAMKSGDAYVKHDGDKWTLGSAAMEKVVELRNGKLLVSSFRNKRSGKEFIAAGTISDELFIEVGDSKERVSGMSGGWTLVDSKVAKLAQGELQLDIAVEREHLKATKHYVVYPKSSIIREWVTFENGGITPLKVCEPGLLNMVVRPGQPDNVDLHWVSGGGFFSPKYSWDLQKESLSKSEHRAFDSYDPFQVVPGTYTYYDGIDGVDVQILLNDKQVWPAKGWQNVPDASVQTPFDLSLDVKPGDRLVFRVNALKEAAYDLTHLNPVIAYDKGDVHTAADEFSDEQGKNGWSYQYVEDGKFQDLVYCPKVRQWRRPKNESTEIPFIAADTLHPDVGRDLVRVWVAPKAGHVRVSGVISVPQADLAMLNWFKQYSFRLGPSRYALWYGLLDRGSGDGIFVSWDYFGHWASSLDTEKNGDFSMKIRIAGHKQTLSPGESLTTPESVIGLFRDDLDNAGNEFLEWQYRYMWDFTRDKWFPGIRMLGYWWKGTTWGNNNQFSKGDTESTKRKVFRVADLIRYCGADVYHRDWGWWDKTGDWGGLDWRPINTYLSKSDIGLLLYAFMYTVDPDCQVVKDHPDWLMPDKMTLDQSKPEVVDHIAKQLDSFYQKYGDFEWRNDSTPLAPRGDDDTPMLKQDQGFREVMRRFLSEHPTCAFQACNCHSNGGSWDYLRYTSTLQITEGGTGLRRNYYTSLVMPPDKTSDMCDLWDPNNYDKATWRGLLSLNFDMSGDTWDLDKLEGVRELVDIYHYLHEKGVVGRWVKVYRPTVDGDDPVMYFQRMSGDNKCGIIIPKRLTAGPVTIRPKGLLPSRAYFVSFQESQTGETRKGAELMKNGIHIDKMLPGELIYLNLPMHPGSKLDKEPPTPASDVTKCAASNMGYPGIELRWKSGTDNNWVSYYEVLRDGKAIDKVAKGTFYFDHSAGADPAAKYELRTVDGSGNRSRPACAVGPDTLRAIVYDDAPGAGITFTGDWERKTGLVLAHDGTISLSGKQGDAAELAFEGNTILWFSKLGADCGKASVSIDGGTSEIVDTYSADDIWGVCVYNKKLQATGKHTIRIEVTGGCNERSSGSVIHMDGIRAERH